jgi:hypothetical protein
MMRKLPDRWSPREQVGKATLALHEYRRWKGRYFINGPPGNSPMRDIVAAIILCLLCAAAAAPSIAGSHQDQLVAACGSECA